jgi:hypothetical protein
MPRCPVCGSDRMHQRGPPNGPLCCEDCGFTVGDGSALPSPFCSATDAAAEPSSAAHGQGDLAAWAVSMKRKKAAKRSLLATQAVPAGGEKARPSPAIPIRTDYLYFPASATVGQVLRACQEHRSPGSTLLLTRAEGAFAMCSLGSLLPYLTGRTPHIVHRHGECPICSALYPMVWRDTAALLTEALASVDVCSRLLSHLPLAGIPAIEAKRLAEDGVASKLAQIGFRACAVTDNGAPCGVYIIAETRTLGGLPDY